MPFEGVCGEVQTSYTAILKIVAEILLLLRAKFLTVNIDRRGSVSYS
jgi:hypothetical protein